MEPVKAPLPEKGKSGNGEGDGVRDAGLAPAVAAGDYRGIPEHQVRGLPIGLEPGDGHAGDLKALDFFHDILLSASSSLGLGIRQVEILQHIVNHGICLLLRQPQVGDDRAHSQIRVRATGKDFQAGSHSVL